ncbi:OmpA family protein [Methylovulum psychrotolerans]|uniref:OmpA family protein n=1 Tax=Methylovulum psychrotolerans TaxID=1704499 RepID=UPI001BFF8C46|nr:OmpA family protein [Methylovulum psychrotolerans]MBT9096860.1 OmpA family protein [Methylovulum psychrotolerans]
MNSEDNNIYAFSIGDAMAGMMLILLMAFLAIFLQMKAIPNQSKEISKLEGELKIAKEKNKNEAEKYFSMKRKIFNDLVDEFEKDLKKWNARIDENTLAFILENSNNGFKAGSAEIPIQFTNMLDQFIPRYINVIRKYDGYINEIRIEGHTSSEWGDNLAECVNNNSESCKQSAYIKNMGLSQTRAMSVLNHILLMNGIDSNRAWIREKLAANGLSSSHLLCGTEKKICTANVLEQENKEASRRVEFSIRTNAESKIEELLKTDKK